MVAENGRDTEKNIYNEKGGYKTILSSSTYKDGCPICKNNIIKEQYLGGSIYYCPNCQK
jgi:formamidopyrimidine-DNA glycosylase